MERAETITARARVLAVRAHGGQKYGDGPYVNHLDEVAMLLRLLLFDDETIAVGYLHDVLEDTAVGPDAIEAEFGNNMAEAVALVTDPKIGYRRERKAIVNTRLAALNVVASHAARMALVVKAADRFANVARCLTDGDESRMRMYRREHAEFRKAVYRPGLCDNLWEGLDRMIGGGQ